MKYLKVSRLSARIEPLACFVADGRGLVAVYFVPDNAKLSQEIRSITVFFVVNKKPIKQLILNRLWYVLNCGFCGVFCGK